MDLMVDKGRLWDSLMEMGKVGGLPNGGCCRRALSDDDRKGRDLFVRWCRKEGCEISIDQVGNIFARRPGRDNSRPAVATGSHLDTQPHGGKFDGIYGVLAGLEVVRTLNEAGIETQAPIDVIVWTNEEAARFNPPLAGSSAFAGLLDVPFLHAVVTQDGTTVHEDLEQIGYLGDEIPGERMLDCFVEAHIEQGPILEAENKTIGVVTQIQGIRWSAVTLTGQDAHAGTTPMNRRRDALVGAAEIVTTLNRLARNEDEWTRLTVGRLEVSPNSGATVPGATSLICDLRHPDANTLERLDNQIQEVIQAVAKQNHLEAKIERTFDAPPVYFSGELIDSVRDAAERLRYAHIDMLSGAAHDAMNLAQIVPTAMIFVPCKDGISHNEAESAKPEDLAAGAHTLLHTLLGRATRA